MAGLFFDWSKKYGAFAIHRFNHGLGIEVAVGLNENFFYTGFQSYFCHPGLHFFCLVSSLHIEVCFHLVQTVAKSQQHAAGRVDALTHASHGRVVPPEDMPPEVEKATSP